jgi:hypothetical protein
MNKVNFREINSEYCLGELGDFIFLIRKKDGYVKVDDMEKLQVPEQKELRAIANVLGLQENLLFTAEVREVDDRFRGVYVHPEIASAVFPATAGVAVNQILKVYMSPAVATPAPSETQFDLDIAYISSVSYFPQCWELSLDRTMELLLRGIRQKDISEYTTLLRKAIACQNDMLTDTKAFKEEVLTKKKSMRTAEEYVKMTCPLLRKELERLSLYSLGRKQELLDTLEAFRRGTVS